MPWTPATVSPVKLGNILAAGSACRGSGKCAGRRIWNLVFDAGIYWDSIFFVFHEKDDFFIVLSNNSV